jgi:hypothetical protein
MEGWLRVEELRSGLDLSLIRSAVGYGRSGETLIVPMDRKRFKISLLLGTGLELFLVSGDGWIWRGAPKWAQLPGIYVALNLASGLGINNLDLAVGIMIVVTFLVQAPLFSFLIYLLLILAARFRSVSS